MNDKQIISCLTPAGHWLKEHLIYFGLFVLCFTIGSLWLIFIDVASTEKSDWETFSAIARNLGLLFLGAIGLPLAIWRSVLAHKQTNIANRNAANAIEQTKIANNNTANALEQTKVTRQGQHAERFAKAAAMLGDNKLPVREAGIFALQELAIADPEGYYFPVQNLLCSFMRDAGQQDREKAGMNRAKPDADAEADATQEVLELPACKSDVTSALCAFSDLRTPKNLKQEEDRGWQPDLHEVNLSKFPGHSRSINLHNAKLSGAALERSNFHDAIFTDAILNSASFHRASLRDANLQKAILNYANLGKTILTNANLQGASFVFATLEKANIWIANFNTASLEEANLQETEIWHSDFQNANLRKANLDGAKFYSEKTEGTKFCETSIQNTKFSLPIWPREDWPKDSEPVEGLDSDCAMAMLLAQPIEYFTFVTIDDDKD